MPSQPANLRVVESRATSVSLSWDPPVHSGENILSYEIYWNDTFTTGVRFFLYLIIMVYMRIGKTFTSNCLLYLFSNDKWCQIVELISWKLFLYSSKITAGCPFPRSTPWRVFTRTLCTTSGLRQGQRGVRGPQRHQSQFALSNMVGITTLFGKITSPCVYKTAGAFCQKFSIVAIAKLWETE